MLNLQTVIAARAPVSIFALNKNKPFAATSIKTWQSIQSMVDDLSRLVRKADKYIASDINKLLSKAANDAAIEIDMSTTDWVTQEEVDELHQKYSFLEFTKHRPGLGDPYSELVARVHVWTDAATYLKYIQSQEDRQYTDAFWEFQKGYSSGIYKCLPEQPAQTPEEQGLLCHYAYDELWTFTQELKLKELTALQEQDRRKLELWIAREIKELLIEDELARIWANRKARAWDSLTVVDMSAAATTVNERIARGDWQTPGLQKFKFNGLD